MLLNPHLTETMLNDTWELCEDINSFNEIYRLGSINEIQLSYIQRTEGSYTK